MDNKESYCRSCGLEKVNQVKPKYKKIYSYKLKKKSTECFCLNCINKSNCYNCKKIIFFNIYYNTKHNVFLCGDCEKNCSDEEIYYLSPDRICDFSYDETYSFLEKLEDFDYTIRPRTKKTGRFF